MIKFAQCNSHFAGKIDKRYGEGGEGRRREWLPRARAESRKKALANATITRSVTAMLPITAQKIARFSMAARRIRRGRSALSRSLTVSSSEIPFRTIVLSTILFQARNQDGNKGGQCSQQKRRRRRL